LTVEKLEIHHNVDQQRFEALLGGEIARADYRLAGGVMRMVHTEVPPAFTGRGIAAQLVRAALEHARRSGFKVQPACSYVRAYIRRHPETQSLLAESRP
jgi:uncharacterized protein